MNLPDLTQNFPCLSFSLHLLGKNVQPPIWEVPLPYISFLLTSQPSTCVPHDYSQDTCHIRVLLKVIEGATSYEITVQVSLPY